MNETYFWAFSGREPIAGVRTICVVTTETFLNEQEIDYYIPHEVTEALEELDFYETMETFYETTLETDEEIQNALEELEYLSYSEDFQKFLDSRT